MVQGIIEFVKRNLTADMVRGGNVLEIGSLNVNGSVREYVESLGPKSYTGIDLQAGPGVDLVMPVNDCINRFGCYQFDVVLCLCTLEHIEDWREAVRQMTTVLRLRGKLVFAAPAPGFPYHPYPKDYWRFTEYDIMHAFPGFSLFTGSQQQGHNMVILRRWGVYQVSNDFTPHRVVIRPWSRLAFQARAWAVKCWHWLARREHWGRFLLDLYRVPVKWILFALLPHLRR
jgi:SAM-dependent methyltransferase